MLDSEALIVLPVFPDGRDYVRSALRLYGSKTDLPDVALLWLAENNPNLCILTTERRGFTRYRLRTKRRELRLITP